MNVLEIRDTIYTYFRDNFSTVPVAYDNAKTDDIQGVFVKFSISLGKSFSVIKGVGTDTRHTGAIYAMVKVPAATGTKQAFTIADELLNLLERKRLGDLVTRAGTATPAKFEDEYYTLVVSVPFVVC